MSGETRVFSREQSKMHDQAKYNQHFFRRVPIITQTYEVDTSDLLPQPKKIGRMNVGLADAEQVRVKTEGPKQVSYAAEPRPEVIFTGKLTIADITDDPAQEPESQTKKSVAEGGGSETVGEVPAAARLAVHQNAAEWADDGGVFHVPVTHRRGRGHLHVYSTSQQAQLTPLSNPDGILGMQRDRIVDRNPRAATLKVDAPVLDTRVAASPFVVGIVGLTALIATVGLVGMYGKVSFDGSVFLEQYGFALQELIAVIKSHIAALIVHSFGQ